MIRFCSNLAAIVLFALPVLALPLGDEKAAPIDQSFVPTITAFVAAYEKDPAAAKERFQDKPVILRGRIIAMTVTGSPSYATIELDSGSKAGRFFARSAVYGPELGQGEPGGIGEIIKDGKSFYRVRSSNFSGFQGNFPLWSGAPIRSPIVNVKGTVKEFVPATKDKPFKIVLEDAINAGILSPPKKKPVPDPSK